MFDIATALRTLVEREGSDLHVKIDSPPVARMHGELNPLEGFGKLTAEDLPVPVAVAGWALAGLAVVVFARYGLRKGAVA